MKTIIHKGSFLLLILLMVSCSKDDNPLGPADEPFNWEYGSTNQYSAPSIPDGVINDASTGVTLRFPYGGTGTVSITSIKNAPIPPGSGSCFKVDYGGTEPVYLEVDTTGGMFSMVMGFGKISGCYDDELGNGYRWVSLPVEEKKSTVVSYELVFPQFQLKSTAQQIGFDHYWINKVSPTTTLSEQKTFVSLQVSSFVGQLTNMLPATLKSTVSGKRSSTHRYSITYDGDYYKGFWWRSLGSLGRLIKPTIHLKLPASANTIAHETSHYFTHLLTDDDFQSDLEGQANLFSDHGILDEVGRNTIVEEYAYFGEYLLTGTGGNYNLEEPYDIFKGKSPLHVDFPSYEGFGAVLLAQMVSTSTSVRDLINGNFTNKPVIGLTPGEVFEIISQKALGIEQLRTNIETKVSNKNKLNVILQRIGWRYSVKGKLVDENNSPIQGATFKNIVRIGNSVYEGGFTTNPSGADGSFTIIGDIFPGTSVLQVISAGDTSEVTITVPYANQTNQTFDLGTITSTGLLEKIKRTKNISLSVMSGVPHLWSWYNSAHGSSGTINDNTSSWELNAGVYSEEPSITWNGSSFTFQYTGSHAGSLISSPYGEATHTSSWTKEITGTLDNSGKIINARFKVEKTDGQTGVYEIIELTLNDIEPSQINPWGNTVGIRWRISGATVSSHLQVVQGKQVNGTVTYTYSSSDWLNAYDPWYNKIDDVVLIDLLP